MYKYIGDFEHLKQLGFIKNKSESYWFLPTDSADRFHNPISISIKNREIEYSNISQLKIIKGYVKEV